MARHRHLLYHGTAAQALPGICERGLQPRRFLSGAAKRGHWQGQAPSHPGCVYLSDAYAAYFALVAADRHGGDGIVLEIDADAVAMNLRPDEDFLEQATREAERMGERHRIMRELRCPERHDMKKRTAWFRRRILLWGELWPESLRLLGTVAHNGTVPVEAITRVARMPAGHDIQFAIDPSITLQNYRVVGSRYRNLSRAIFDRWDELESSEIDGRDELWESLDPKFAAAHCFDESRLRDLVQGIDVQPFAEVAAQVFAGKVVAR